MRPALLVVDVTYGFTGAESPGDTGVGAWEAMPTIASAIGLFRDRGLPVVFTRADTDGQRFTGRASARRGPGRTTVPDDFGDFPAAIAPRDDEWVLAKTRASPFVATPLPVYLTRERIDTVVICGGLTSACIRATATDATSSGRDAIVIADACFDRARPAHDGTLETLGATYAEVLTLDTLASTVLAQKPLQATSKETP
ncbi:isochorismatase family protein [Microbacterium sp. MEC084]|uniref:cysteine hydrolase family protein n=1 Tax=unclassified Microbacterium TaxID=2609290 RepID=UPI0006F43AFE|nr:MULTISPECIES: isochorismatase family protein [unclassified Microbacterium]KQZ11751.1 hypothetical protein ASD19_00230 [Microbacterium sp. Root53]MCD1269369.1 isochorismatase family protein [Microbacterium sp. MEC084]